MKEKSLDEFFESYGAAKVLRENLEMNLDTLGYRLTKQDKEMLMRINLIAIRQCLEDFGAE